MSFQFSTLLLTKQLPKQLLKQNARITIEKSALTAAPSFSKAAFHMAVMIGAVAVLSLSAQAYERIVAMSPDVADVVVALAATDKLVGKDATNNNPALKNVPAVGMHRNITAESVLAVKPDLVLGSYMVQPASIYQRLNGLKVKAVNVSPKEEVSTFAGSIKSIGSYVDKKSTGSQLAQRWQVGMSPMAKTGKRYLLSYDGRIVAGKGTVGDELIRRAGGINAANVSGLKPMYVKVGWLLSPISLSLLITIRRSLAASVNLVSVLRLLPVQQVKVAASIFGQPMIFCVMA